MLLDVAHPILDVWDITKQLSHQQLKYMVELETYIQHGNLNETETVKKNQEKISAI